MRVGNKHYRTIWLKEDNPKIVQIIDQRPLPHKFVVEDITNTDEMAKAIKEMHLRGAGLIGAAAGYGMYLAGLESKQNTTQAHLDYLKEAGEKLKSTRPTAVNLEWAVHRQLAAVKNAKSVAEINEILLNTAKAIADEDANYCKSIGENGVEIIEKISKAKNGETVNILTHCNAGWLAFVDYGSATAPIYEAQKRGIKVHVWVDETRPRNQGARLTAWELGEQGVPHTIIADNVGGHLMQHGMVDMVIVGSDRTSRCGDVGNKIGTYLKATAAKDNNVPFYVALPSSTIDWDICDGVKEIPIEERGSEEVKYIAGMHDGELKTVLLAPENSAAVNYSFDVTPARLVTALITERGVMEANEKSIISFYPERQQANGL